MTLPLLVRPAAKYAAIYGLAVVMLAGVIAYLAALSVAPWVLLWVLAAVLSSL
jgi:hypothetical protein